MKPKKLDRGVDNADSLLSPFSVSHALIQDALHRCKDSEVATRITVTFTRVSETEELYRISVGDTGYGLSESILKEYFPYHVRGGTAEFVSHDLHWDGILLITTTCEISNITHEFCCGIHEELIHHYEIKLGNQLVNHKVTETFVQCKHKIFRGTESSILVKGKFIALQVFIQDVCNKISILNLKDVFLELCEEKLDCSEIQETSCLSICDGGKGVAERVSSLERLHFGLEAYSLKHFHKFTEELTQQGLPKWSFKIGKTQRVVEGHKRPHWILQVCVLLIVKAEENEDKPSSHNELDMQTQVVFFDNHSYCLRMPKMILRALSKVNWSSMGLRFKNVCESQRNTTPTIIEWHQYPEKIARLDLVLHNISNSSPETAWKETFLVAKDTIDAALTDLKAKSPQLFSNPREIQVRTSIPDLAGCISSIIRSSESQDFQEECAGILGLSPGNLSTMGQVIEARLFAAFNKENDRTEEDHPCSFPDCEETLDLMAKAKEMERCNSDSERVDIWNYL